MRAAWAGVAAALLVGACGAGTEDWVAQVDRVEIPLEALQRAAEPRLEDTDEADRPALYADELERLVTTQLVLNRAAELGVEVGDDEVDSRIQLVHGSNFESPGERYHEDVRRQMTAERTVLYELAPRAEISEEQILRHFEENLEQYARPAQVQIRQIVVEDRDKSLRLRAELDTGGDFTNLAREHGRSPEAANGGLLPPFAKGEMPEVFDSAFDLKVGQISDVIESRYGFHLFVVVSKLPPDAPELGEVREEILVALQKRRLAELRRGWLRELRLKAEIRVNERLLESLR